MGGDSSMSTVESGLEFPTGTENELLRIRGGAQLWLIDGEESVLMQSGDFAFRVMKQTQSPLATAVSLVADLQWPVGKDSPALRVGNRKYTFALPGLVYGLALPVNTPVEAIQGLEGLLQRYSTFETHPEISDGVDINEQSWLLQVRQQHQAADYWTTVAPEVEKLSTKIAPRINGGFWSGAEFRGPDRTIQFAATGAHNSNSNGGHDPAISPRMMKRIQQGRRMSAVAKLLSKTLIRGAIDANRHVSGGQYLLGESNVSPNSPMAMAVAGVDAFAKVVEAVETAGRGLFEVAATGSELVQQPGGSNPNLEMHQGAWTLNRSGLRLLLRATAASAVIHVARGVGASSGLPHGGSIPREPDAPSDDKDKYAAHFVPGPSSEALGQSSDSVCSVRGGHRPNSPFQQYSRAVDHHFPFLPRD